MNPNVYDKVTELESIRGIAALLVAIYHIPGWNSHLYDLGIIRNGYLMVQLFFVLSGFVIYRAYSKKLCSFKDLAKFQFLRLGRLYPVHLLMLAVFFAIESAKFVAANFFGVHSPNSSPFVENNWVAFVQQLFMIQAIGATGNAETFNGPAWSISVEFYTYLVFGLIMLFAKRIHMALMVTIGSIACVALGFGYISSFATILLCFTGFFTGCITAFLISKISFQLTRFSTGYVLCLLLFYMQFKPKGEFDLLIFPITALLIFSIICTADTKTKKLLRTPMLAWLGLISYSVYMTHTAVLWVFIQIYRVAFKKPETLVAGKSVSQLTIIEASFTYIAAIAVIILISHLTYRLIEAPLRKQSREIVFKSQSVGVN